MMFPGALAKTSVPTTVIHLRRRMSLKKLLRDTLRGAMVTDIDWIRYTVAATTIWSGASYVYSKDAVKILTGNESETKQKDKT